MADNYIARTAGSWMIVGMLPDVCKTPMGPSTPPIPYPVVAKLADSSSPVPSVRANGKPVVVFARSFVPTTIGGPVWRMVSKAARSAVNAIRRSIPRRYGLATNWCCVTGINFG